MSRLWQTVEALYVLLNVSNDNRLTEAETMKALPHALRAVFRNSDQSLDDDSLKALSFSQCSRMFTEASPEVTAIDPLTYVTLAQKPRPRAIPKTLSLDDFRLSYERLLHTHVEPEVLYMDVRRSVSALVRWHISRNMSLVSQLTSALECLWPVLNRLHHLSQGAAPQPTDAYADAIGGRGDCAAMEEVDAITTPPSPSLWAANKLEYRAICAHARCACAGHTQHATASPPPAGCLCTCRGLSLQAALPMLLLLSAAAARSSKVHTLAADTLHPHHFLSDDELPGCAPAAAGAESRAEDVLGATPPVSAVHRYLWAVAQAADPFTVRARELLPGAPNPRATLGTPLSPALARTRVPSAEHDGASSPTAAPAHLRAAQPSSTHTLPPAPTRVDVHALLEFLLVLANVLPEGALPQVVQLVAGWLGAPERQWSECEDLAATLLRGGNAANDDACTLLQRVQALGGEDVSSNHRRPNPFASRAIAASSRARPVMRAPLPPVPSAASATSSSRAPAHTLASSAPTPSVPTPKLGLGNTRARPAPSAHLAAPAPSIVDATGPDIAAVPESADTESPLTAPGLEQMQSLMARIAQAQVVFQQLAQQQQQQPERTSTDIPPAAHAARRARFVPTLPAIPPAVDDDEAQGFECPGAPSRGNA